MTSPEMIEIVRIGEDFGRWHELLALIMASFAYMEEVIDPPSSAHRLTPGSLAQKARDEIGFVAVENGKLVGCVFCKLESASLYVGKLAIAPSHQRRGLGRRLLAAAEETARKNGLLTLRLETRIELAANHLAFSRWGFEKTAENSHPGYSRVTSIEMQKRLA